MNRGAQRQRRHEPCFLGRELREPARRLVARRLQGQFPEQLAVTRFRCRETAIDAAQLRVAKVLREERETFAAAQLDERRDEEPVEQTLGARMPDALLQRLRVRIAGIRSERQPALLQ